MNKERTMLPRPERMKSNQRWKVRTLRNMRDSCEVGKTGGKRSWPYGWLTNGLGREEYTTEAVR